METQQLLESMCTFASKLVLEVHVSGLPYCSLKLW